MNDRERADDRDQQGTQALLILLVVFWKLQRREDLAPDPRSPQRPAQTEPGRTRLIGHRNRTGRSPSRDRMCSCDGGNRDWTSSPVTPSIAAATTDQACTSSPTLVRSIHTGASHECRIGRAGGPCSVTHESRE